MMLNYGCWKSNKAVNVFPSTFPLFLWRTSTIPELTFEVPHGLGKFGLWISVQPMNAAGG